VYWETCGNSSGKPALVFHGDPGSGCSPFFRTLFDPSAYRVVLFDQRNCGRSTPHASDPRTDLSANNTDNVTEIVLSAITTGRHAEFDWLFRGGLARFFPEEWERLRDALPPGERDRDLVEAYHRLLEDPEPGVRRRAAEAWCLWPTGGLAERFRDPDYALAFARIVTHYLRHNAWLEDGALLRGAAALAEIPGKLVHGRFDFQAPIENAYALSRAWPQAELVVVDDAGHVPTGELGRQIARATDAFR
jgi:proline iminopeptidase